MLQQCTLGHIHGVHSWILAMNKRSLEVTQLGGLLAYMEMQDTNIMIISLSALALMDVKLVYSTLGFAGLELGTWTRACQFKRGSLFRTQGCH